jgi:hypothetical protein
MSLPRVFRLGMQGPILFLNASSSQPATYLRSVGSQAADRRLHIGAAARVQSLTWPAIMKNPAGRPSASVTACSMCSYRPFRGRSEDPVGAGPPFLDLRLVTMPCASRKVASIITGFGTAASEARPSIIRAKMPLSRHRFKRLSRVLRGQYSLH